MHQTADPFALKHAAILAARGLADGTTKATTKKKNLVSRLLEDNPLGRKVLFKKAQEQVVKTTDGHYPAPFDILDCIRTVRGLARRCELDLLRATHVCACGWQRLVFRARIRVQRLVTRQRLRRSASWA